MGYSQLSVGGSVTLMAGAALNVIDDPGTYTLGSRYTIVTAKGGVNGTFGSSVTYNPIFTRYISRHCHLRSERRVSGVGPDSLADACRGPAHLVQKRSAGSRRADRDGERGRGRRRRDPERRLRRRGVAHGQPDRGLRAAGGLGSGYHSEVWLRGIGGFGNLSGGGFAFRFL